MSTGSGGRDFGRFHIDPVERTLHHGGEPVALRGKAFELLTLLLSRAPRLVERATIVEALWPGLAVHENNLAVTVSAVRKTLQKHEPNASYIQTVPKRGYRWIQPEHPTLAAARPGASSGLPAAGEAGDAGADAACVGREGELRYLLEHLRGAAQALGRVVFIAGEAGIGKTTLLSGFVHAARQQQPGVLVLTGACLQLFGAAEPCLPWFWALREALASADGELWLEALREHAPGWYSQLSGAAQPAPPGPRQLVDALCTISRRRPLLVLLEDFHWADASSVDALRALGVAAARYAVLVLVTYRPADARLKRQALGPLLEDWTAERRREQLVLSGWSPAQLRDYLGARFGAFGQQLELAQVLWRRTEGSPFFATRLIDSLVERELLRRQSGSGWVLSRPPSEIDLSASPSVSALIGRQMTRVSRIHRRILDAASVAGAEFDTAWLSRVLGRPPALLERHLDALASLHGLLDRVGDEEPRPGCLTVRYRFSHVLVQSHLYDALESHRRRQLHRLAARALLAEEADAGPPRSVATPAGSPRRPARLAVHFERGGELLQAVVYWTSAGDQAERAHAKIEALSCYARAERLASALPREEGDLRRLFLRYGQGWANFNLRRLRAAERNFLEVAQLASGLQGEGAQIARLRELAFQYFTRPWVDALIQRPSGILPAKSPSEVPADLQAEALCCCCQVLARADRGAALGARAEQLLALSRARGSAARRAEAMAWLATHARMLGRTWQAQALLEDALLSARSCHYERALHLALWQSAELHLARTELAAARDVCEELLGRVPAAASAAFMLLRLGEARAKLGELGGALVAVRRAEALLRQLEPRVPALHGWLLRELGQPVEALRLDQTAVAGLRSLSDATLLGDALASLAHTQARLGQLEEAQSTLEEAEALFGPEQRACAARWHATWAVRCELHFRRRRWAKLEEAARTFVAVAREQAHAEGVMAAERWWAQAHLARGELRPARFHVEASLEVSKTHPLALSDWRSHALVAEIAARSGDAQLASTARAKARSQVRAIGRELEPADRSAWLAACSLRPGASPGDALPP